ncbi:hypothetical protein U1Q18_039578 [Sarracenia purpurea var. burkii]
MAGMRILLEKPFCQEYYLREKFPPSTMRHTNDMNDANVMLGIVGDPAASHLEPPEGNYLEWARSHLTGPMGVRLVVDLAKGVGRCRGRGRRGARHKVVVREASLGAHARQAAAQPAQAPATKTGLAL